MKEIETLILSTNVLSTNTNLAWVGAGALNALGMMSGIVLAPALAVGGFMMASKAEKALTEAIEYNADVDIAIAEMKRNEIILQALQANAIEMGSTLIKLAERFDEIKVNGNDDPESFERMIILGKGLKNLLDVAIMEKDGSATKNIKTKISGYLEI